MFPRVNCWTTRSVLNYFLSLSAFLGNALILIAFHKESSLHPPSKLLLRNLATADLCVGLISEPLFVTYYCKSVVNGHWNICRYTLIAGYITGNILCSVSLLTITAISVDRLLALFLGLRYKQVVKIQTSCEANLPDRCYLLGCVHCFFSNVVLESPYNHVVWHHSLVISIFSYSKIFFTLNHRQNQVQGHVQQPNQTNQLNIARYKKAVSTAIWLQLTLVAFYLPYGVVLALTTSNALSSSLFHAWSYIITLVHLRERFHDCCK